MELSGRIGVVVACLLVLAVGTAWWCWPQCRSLPRSSAAHFDGVRGRMSGVTYMEDNPETGTGLVVRARGAVIRDATVGKVFRTPLRTVVELSGVEAELRGPAGRWVLKGASKSGSYNPLRGSVSLHEPSPLRLSKREIRTGHAIFESGGTVTLPNGYEVYEGGKLLWRGQEFRGWAAKLVEGP